MSGMLLALAASCAWGLSDFLGGNRSRNTALPVVLAGSQFAGLATLAVVLVVAPGAAPSVTGLGATPLLLAAAAGACGVLSLGLLYVAMARRGTAVVAPIAAGAAALPVAVALAQGEALGPRAAAGLVLALAGTFLAASSGASSEAPSEAPSGGAGPTPAGRPDAVALAAATGSAVAAGGFLTLIRVASAAGDPLAVTLANRLTACALVGAWLLGRLPDLRRTGPGALGVGGLAVVAAVGAADAAAEVCFALASRHAPASVVAPLSSLYPAVAVLLALVLLRERLGRRGGAGVFSAVAGVALLA